MTRTKKPFFRSALELVVIVAVALGLALGIQAFLVKPYEIPSGSMEPTLQIGQRVLVDRIGTHFIVAQDRRHPRLPPARDETCANPNEGQNTDGQQFGRAVRRGRQDAVVADLHQARRRAARRPIFDPQRPRVPQRRAGDGLVHRALRRRQRVQLPDPDHVPPGDYYMMGDNRPDSLDSRFWGPVPKAWIIGEAFFTYWPPDRIGLL